MIESYSEHPLPALGSQKYAGIAFDGCFYYLTLSCENQIVVMDRSFCQLRCVDTRRAYGAICYDLGENCFWAYSATCYGKLFKLNACLQEIDCLTVSVFHKYVTVITGVSACCESCGLLASADGQILHINKQTGCAEVLCKERNSILVNSVVCAPPFVIYNVLKNTKQTLVIMASNGEKVEEISIPDGYWIKSALLYPCKDCRGGYHLYMLSMKHSCYAYLLDLRLDQCLSDALCPCNEALCQKCCKPDCPTPCCSKQSCNDIVESIALQEAALAHILNAEGEKIQKAVAESSDICELLSVNESVQKTIVRVTHLEQILYSKLDAIQSYCNTCDANYSSPCLPLPHCGGCSSCDGQIIT